MRTSLLNLLFFFCASACISQERNPISIYGNAGFGYSRTNYTDRQGGSSARLGLTTNYRNLLIRFDRTINNEFLALFAPPEKISANSILVGYGFQPFQSRPEIYLNSQIGYGRVESIKRGRILNYEPFNNEYELITENSNAWLWEVDFELMATQNLGFSLNIFSNYNSVRTFYGATFCILFGLF
jgi:hypothetical protein